MAEFSIQISADLVNRLLDDDEKSKKKVKKTKTKIPNEASRPKTKAHEKQLHDDYEMQKGPAAQGWPVPPPFFLPVTPPVQAANPALDEIRSVVLESERVLENLQKKEVSMVEEVTARAKDLRDKEFKLPYQKPMPCLADYDACQACYKEHTMDILKCAPLTKSYYDCVRRVKQQVSSADK